MPSTTTTLKPVLWMPSHPVYRENYGPLSTLKSNCNGPSFKLVLKCPAVIGDPGHRLIVNPYGNKANANTWSWDLCPSCLALVAWKEPAKAVKAPKVHAIPRNQRATWHEKHYYRTDYSPVIGYSCVANVVGLEPNYKFCAKPGGKMYGINASDPILLCRAHYMCLALTEKSYLKHQAKAAKAAASTLVGNYLGHPIYRDDFEPLPAGVTPSTCVAAPLHMTASEAVTCPNKNITHSLSHAWHQKSVGKGGYWSPTWGPICADHYAALATKSGAPGKAMPTTPPPTYALRFGGSLADFNPVAKYGWSCNGVVLAHTGTRVTCPNPVAWSSDVNALGLCDMHYTLLGGKGLGGSARSPIVSQKAKGIRAIAYYANSFGSDTSPFLRNVACAQAKVWPAEGEPYTFPIFARPCPTRPRHGFVDSRLVSTKDEWDALKVEVAKAEKGAEIVAMPLIDADYSGILTKHGVTIGPGNDGATSGHGSVAIPTPGARCPILWVAPNLHKQAAITQAAYAEFVCAKGSNVPELVQVRDGPSQPLMDRAVPEAVTVASVVKAEGDLLEWETHATEFTPGTVVWHPGGSLASHYAVHCVINKVPILCTAEAPKVGDTIEPSVGPRALTQADYDAIAASMFTADGRIKAPIGTEKGTMREWCRIGTGMLHAQSVWGPDPHLLRLRGAASGAMLRLATAAILGELRHYYVCGPGVDADDGGRGATALTKGIRYRKGDMAVNRTEVQQVAFDMPWPQLMEALGTATYDMAHWANYSGGYSSFGGKNWYECSKATVSYAEAIGDFIKKPGKGTWDTAILALNRIINIAHNGGKFLNKYMDQGEFDRIASAPGLAFLGPIAACIAMESCGPSPPVPKKIGRTILRAIKDAPDHTTIAPPPPPKRAAWSLNTSAASTGSAYYCEGCGYHGLDLNTKMCCKECWDSNVTIGQVCEKPKGEIKPGSKPMAYGAWIHHDGPSVNYYCQGCGYYNVSVSDLYLCADCQAAGVSNQTYGSYDSMKKKPHPKDAVKPAPGDKAVAVKPEPKVEPEGHGIPLGIHKAQLKMNYDGKKAVHIQAKMAEVNRAYGLVLDVPNGTFTDEVRKAWGKVPGTAKSLAGGDKLYAPCVLNVGAEEINITCGPVSAIIKKGEWTQ